MNSKLLNYSRIIFKALFFVFFYLYVLFYVNPAISYFIQQPVFLVNKEYLKEHLNYPGGLIEYLSQFIAQFYYYPWLGALLLTLVVFCVSYFTGKLVGFLKFNKHILILQLIPVIGLLFVHSRHDYILTTTMILLSSVVFFYLYLQFTKQRLIIRSAGLIVSSVILYYLSGGSALLLYLSMCLVAELFYLKKNDIVVIPLLIIFAGLIPYLSARFVFYITAKQAYLYLLLPEPYYHPPLILYMLFVYFLLLIVYIKAAGLEFFKGISVFNIQKTVNEKHIPIFSFIIQVIVIIILAALTVKFAIIPEQAFINKVKYLAYYQEWEKLLMLVEENPSNDRFVNFHTNRALYHTGKLADNLFDYPQTWGKHALFMGEIVIRTILMDNSDLYFDMGHIGAAQHWAYEAQTIYENSPRVLKRLALTNIILGKYKPAGSILGILRSSLIDKGWAEYYKQCIDDPAKLQNDSLIQNKRDLNPTTIFFMDRKNVNYDLLYMLEDNEKNKMVFEYLMAYYLLSNDIGNVVKNLGYLKVLGYKKIPRIYEEALLVYLSKIDIKRVNLGGYAISKNTIERYRDYALIVHRNNNDIQASQGELFNSHGNTYWYYLHFTSPVTSKKELKFKAIE
jgi:hypothetical protein